MLSETEQFKGIEVKLGIFDSYERYKCTEVAREIARRLVKEGKSPSIIRLGHEINTCREDTLTPKEYPHLRWRYHDVCEEGGNIWDPIIGRPLPKQEYFKEMFGKEFSSREYVSSETLKKEYEKN